MRPNGARPAIDLPPGYGMIDRVLQLRRAN